MRAGRWMRWLAGALLCAALVMGGAWAQEGEGGQSEGPGAPAGEAETDASPSSADEREESEGDRGEDDQGVAPEAAQPGTTETVPRLRIEVEGAGNERAPEELVAALRRAVAAWEAAAERTLGIDVVLAEGAGGEEGSEDGSEDGDREAATTPPDVRRAVARWAERDRFGPDTRTLTLQRPGEPTTLLVSPGADDAALLHEIGLLLGLEPTFGNEAPSAMRPALASATEDRVERPGAADLAALEALLRFPPADLNRDGVVDFYDLLELAESFGARGFLPADLDGNGVVDEADLERLRAAYTFTPPAESPPASEGTDAEDGEGEDPRDEARGDAREESEGTPGSPDDTRDQR